MDVLIVTEEDKIAIQKHYNTNKVYLKRDIQIIKDWIRKQPHLPQNIQDDAFFENFLIRNKCLVEKTKEKIDDFFTVKSIYKHIFSGHGTVFPSKSPIYFLPLRQLTENKERIVFIGIRNAVPEAKHLEEMIRIMISVGELMWKYDYYTAVRIVIDLKGASMEFIKKIDLFLLTTFVKTYQLEFSSKIAGVECINIPSFFAFGLTIIKSSVKAKIFNRIRTYDSLESLYNIIPKEILPKEYGGNECELEELVRKWDKVFELHEDLFKTAETQVSNENLRQEKSRYAGNLIDTSGTFKKLDID